jgi:hypothetical protein
LPDKVALMKASICVWRGEVIEDSSARVHKMARIRATALHYAGSGGGAASRATPSPSVGLADWQLNLVWVGPVDP